jgi:carbamate kinase
MGENRQKKVVVALGHNALGYTTMEQWDAVQVTAKALADLVEAGYQLTITHSNGPQVSMIHKAMTELRRVYIDYTPAPMCVCSAMSQGYVGFDIQNSLRAELLSRGNSTAVSTILTQVSVDPYDEAFYSPTKKIGRYMSKEDAENEIKKGNFRRRGTGEGDFSASSQLRNRWRSWRSIPSGRCPMPVRSSSPAAAAVFPSSCRTMR